MNSILKLLLICFCIALVNNANGQNLNHLNGFKKLVVFSQNRDLIYSDILQEELILRLNQKNKIQSIKYEEFKRAKLNECDVAFCLFTFGYAGSSYQNKSTISCLIQLLDCEGHEIHKEYNQLACDNVYPSKNDYKKCLVQNYNKLFENYKWSYSNYLANEFKSKRNLNQNTLQSLGKLIATNNSPKVRLRSNNNLNLTSVEIWDSAIVVNLRYLNKELASGNAMVGSILIDLAVLMLFLFLIILETGNLNL
ncbi:MAG: hypothetical protein IPM92_12745 [Saprospiraceae bacterium]|nr:hypothetical protein [Saprospiraceae bacterium]